MQCMSNFKERLCKLFLLVNLHKLGTRYIPRVEAHNIRRYQADKRIWKEPSRSRALGWLNGDGLGHFFKEQIYFHKNSPLHFHLTSIHNQAQYREKSRIRREQTIQSSGSPWQYAHWSVNTLYSGYNAIRDMWIIVYLNHIHSKATKA